VDFLLAAARQDRVVAGRVEALDQEAAQAATDVGDRDACADVTG
jgi:hypothetical protein